MAIYKVIMVRIETCLASLNADLAATGLPTYVQREFYDYLQCGIPAHSFLLLEGGHGNDILIGGNGKDILREGSGDNLLRGGEKSDTCDGGAHVTGDTVIDCAKSPCITLVHQRRDGSYR